MSQPNTTSQKPNPPSAAEKNLSLWMYLPRSTPSMSDTATLTRVPAAARTASSTFLAGTSCGISAPRGCRRSFAPSRAILCHPERSKGTAARVREQADFRELHPRNDRQDKPMNETQPRQDGGSHRRALAALH